MATSGATAQRTENATRHAYITGTLKSGRSGKPAKNRKHAVARGLSDARRKGATLPAAISNRTPSVC